jgi:hypothetical protein
MMIDKAFKNISLKEGQQSQFCGDVFSYVNSDHLENGFRKGINSFSFLVFKEFIRFYDDFILDMDIKPKGSGSDCLIDVSSGHF